MDMSTRIILLCGLTLMVVTAIYGAVMAGYGI